MAAQDLDRSSHALAGTVLCVICKAVYAPSPPYEYLLQAPPVARESAFMSMCHFCFRCRRPACPNCWDDVHGVCGACSLESDIPFRVPSPSLRGSLLAPPRQAQAVRACPVPVSLICVRPGRFQRELFPPVDVLSTTPLQSVMIKTSNSIVARTEKPEGTNGVPDAMLQSRKATKASRSVSPFDIDQLETRPGRRKQVSRWWELMLTTVVFIVVLTVVLLIVLALLSDRANTSITSILHVDIRAEIAYLWQLIGHH